MNYHAPSLPTLNTGNMAAWKLAIDCEAQVLGIEEHVANPDYQPDPFQHRSVAALTGAIIYSLPQDVASAVINPGSGINPAKLILCIQEHIRTQSEADHEALELEADYTLITQFETIEKYFETHELIRTRMVNAHYPHITSERTTVKFMLRGMRRAPALALVIRHCCASPPTTIKDLKSITEAMQSMHHIDGLQQPLSLYTTSYQQPPTRAFYPTPTNTFRSPRTFCRHHASKGRILLHADKDCMDPTNPTGINYSGTVHQ